MQSDYDDQFLRGLGVVAQTQAQVELMDAPQTIFQLQSQLMLERRRRADALLSLRIVSVVAGLGWLGLIATLLTWWLQ